MSARVPIGSTDYTYDDLRDLLTQARDLISDEARWCTGQWVSGLAETAPGTDPATCSNVRMCAMGAVLVVRFGKLLATEFRTGTTECDSEEEFFEQYFKRDQMATEAWNRLNATADDMNEIDVISLNDALAWGATDHDERIRHLSRVLDCFTATINSIIPARPA